VVSVRLPSDVKFAHRSKPKLISCVPPSVRPPKLSDQSLTALPVGRYAANTKFTVFTIWSERSSSYPCPAASSVV
jgi:hypothetical protein